MNETLEHHGILGMKWGVRRYQNKDGTWTEEGKEHRAKPTDESKELTDQENIDKYGVANPTEGMKKYWESSTMERATSPMMNEVADTDAYKIYAEVFDYAGNRKYDDYKGQYGNDPWDDVVAAKADVVDKVQEMAKKYLGDHLPVEEVDELIDDRYWLVDQKDGRAKKEKPRPLIDIKAEKAVDDYYKTPMWERPKTRLGDALAGSDEYKKYKEIQAKVDDEWSKHGKVSKKLEKQLDEASDKVASKAVDISRDYFYGKETISYQDGSALAWDRYQLDLVGETKHSDDVSDFLMHYGVKGQSWGKRNFQYEDGTLTAEGKERYSKGLTRSGASVFRSGKPKIGQQVWTAKRSMTKVGDLPEETKEKLLERVRQARQGGAKDEEDSSIPGMTRTFEAKRTEMSPEEREKLKSVTPKSLGATQEMVKTELSEMPPEEKEESGIPGMTRTFEAKRTEMSPEEREKLKSATPKSLGATQEMAKTNLSELSPEEKEKLKKKRAAAIKPVEPKKAVTMSDSSEDILEHHGILGMKWGIRRYQNADGSLTAAGRKRYGVDDNDAQRSSSGQSSGSNSDTTTRTPAKSASEMTDQELQSALNRLRMEQQYNELTGAKSSNQYQNQQNFSTPPSNTGNLSNAELQAYITRLDMEKRYAQLTAPPPKEVSAGKKFMNDVVGPAINQVAKAFIVASLSKALGLKGDGDNGGNNNNNGGKKNNNDDSQYKSLKKELNDLKSMMGSQKKQQDNGGNQKKESSRDRDNDSESSSLPEPQRNTHRDSIFSATRDAARQAREQQREQKRQERAQQRENDRFVRETLAEGRRDWNNYQKQERAQQREERRQQSLIDNNRRYRESQNRWSSVSAFLSGLERQNGMQDASTAQDYRTSGEKWFDSYLERMGR